MPSTATSDIRVVHDRRGRAVEVILPIAEYLALIERAGDEFDLDLVERSRSEPGPDIPLSSFLPRTRRRSR